MAKTVLRYFTDAQIELIREIVHSTLQSRQNTPSRPPADRSWEEGEDHQAPEVYIARVPPNSSIPGATVIASGSTKQDSPGVAPCHIYLIDDSGTDPVLTLIDGAEQRVYNLYRSAVGGAYAPVLRDKYGKWLVAVGREIRYGTLQAALAAKQSLTAVEVIESRFNENADATGGTWNDVQNPDGTPLKFLTVNPWDTALSAGIFVACAPTQSPGIYAVIQGDCKPSSGGSSSTSPPSTPSGSTGAGSTSTPATGTTTDTSGSTPAPTTSSTATDTTGGGSLPDTTSSGTTSSGTGTGTSGTPSAPSTTDTSSGTLVLGTGSGGSNLTGSSSDPFWWCCQGFGCVYNTKDGLVQNGFVILSGPYSTAVECLGACGGT